MKDESAILNTVIEKFPQKANTLGILFQRDENFREVCEHYHLCKEAINKMIITNNQKRKILKDYKSTLKELELEMLTYLDKEITTNIK